MGYLYYFVGIEVEADYRVVAFGMLRFFFNGEAISLFVEFGYTVTFGVVDPVAEDGGFAFFFCCLYCILQNFGETCSMEYVVAEDKTCGVITDEVFANYKGLGEAIGGWLLGICEVDSIVAAVSEETLETREVLWGGDDKDIADSGKHEGGDGIVYHRLVEYGEELLANSFCYWI